jgi:ribosomal protein L36
MKVRASVKKKVPSAKLCEEKGLYVINKRILDLNKDKDNYGKNSRGRYPKKRGVIALTYIFGLGK